MTRWRQRQGEDRLQALVQESLAVAVKVGAAKPRDFTQAIVDTTVAEKNIAFPTDAKLIHRARERLVRQAQEAGIDLRQSYVRVTSHFRTGAGIWTRFSSGSMVKLIIYGAQLITKEKCLRSLPQNGGIARQR